MLYSKMQVELFQNVMHRTVKSNLSRQPVDEQASRRKSNTGRRQMSKLKGLTWKLNELVGQLVEWLSFMCRY
jgi:hypothetical protein